MLPGSLVDGDVALCVTTVCPATAGWAGWMTGVELMVMARLPCAMAHEPGRDGLVEHDGTGAGVDDHSVGRRCFQGSSSRSAMKPTRASGLFGARTCTVRPSEPWRWPGRCPAWLLMACHLAGGLEVRGVQAQVGWCRPRCSGVGTGVRPARSCGMRPAQVVDLHLQPPCAAPAPPTTRLPWARA